MMANRTLRIVEAFHMVVLTLFSAWVPFCFKAMPLAAPRMLEVQVADTSSLVQMGLPTSAKPENQRLPAELAQVERQGVGALVGWTEAATAGREKGGGGDGGGGGGRSAWCGSGSPGALQALPFLIALVGGGVFSLEAFEAFPML
mmetsp:Transcript_34657/g.78377  ORF Transcript_34657/g.78377 Transcript_34657/m.78377 type:complete len:145 (+) Transcript_34657:67-501(+)